MTWTLSIEDRASLAASLRRRGFPETAIGYGIIEAAVALGIVAPVEQSEAAPTLCPGEDARDRSRDAALADARLLAAYDESVCDRGIDAYRYALLHVLARLDHPERFSPAPTVSDAEARALIESLRAICKRWNERAEKHRCGAASRSESTASCLCIHAIKQEPGQPIRHDVRCSESTDARRVATPGFAEADGRIEGLLTADESAVLIEAVVLLESAALDIGVEIIEVGEDGVERNAGLNINEVRVLWGLLHRDERSWQRAPEPRIVLCVAQERGTS